MAAKDGKFNSGHSGSVSPQKQEAWRIWYNHGLMPSYMHDVGSCPLLTSEEEEELLKKFSQSRRKILHLLQKYPQVLLTKLKELRDDPNRKKLATYMVFTKQGQGAPDSEEELLEDADPQLLNGLLENSPAFIRDCTQKAANGIDCTGSDIHSIAEIIAPYLRTGGKIHFQQRFFVDCVELFINGKWDAPAEVSSEEKQELSRQMREARDKQQSAMNALVEGNLRLVISVAKHFANSYLSLPDLVQEGNIGLMRAIETFEWRRGFRLSTYAYYRIRQAISQALNSTGRSIRIPTTILRQITKIHHCEQLYLQKNDHDASEETLAEMTGLSTARIRALRRMEQQPISLQAISSDERDWNDLLVDESYIPETRTLPENLRDSLISAMSVLKENERDIILRRFGLNGRPPQSLEVIAKSYGLTSERIRQIESAALAKLRKNYNVLFHPED